MPDKKRVHFWQLALIFGAITVLAMAYNWGYRTDTFAGMMGSSMGNMMSSMHLGNVTISDLITQQEQQEMMTGQGFQSQESHHVETGAFLKSTHYLTTATIIILLPFILAGTVFLTIVWLK